MNGKQKVVLWIGVLIFLLMGIFPPWVHVFNQKGYFWQEDAGYSCRACPEA